MLKKKAIAHAIGSRFEQAEVHASLARQTLAPRLNQRVSIFAGGIKFVLAAMKEAVEDVISMADKYRLENDEARINRALLVNLKKQAMAKASEEARVSTSVPFASDIAKLTAKLIPERFVPPDTGNMRVYIGAGYMQPDMKRESASEKLLNEKLNESILHPQETEEDHQRKVSAFSEAESTYYSAEGETMSLWKSQGEVNWASSSAGKTTILLERVRTNVEVATRDSSSSGERYQRKYLLELHWRGKKECFVCRHKYAQLAGNVTRQSVLRMFDRLGFTGRRRGSRKQLAASVAYSKVGTCAFCMQWFYPVDDSDEVQIPRVVKRGRSSKSLREKIAEARKQSEIDAAGDAEDQTLHDEVKKSTLDNAACAAHFRYCN